MVIGFKQLVDGLGNLPLGSLLTLRLYNANVAEYIKLQSVVAHLASQMAYLQEKHTVAYSWEL